MFIELNQLNISFLSGVIGAFWGAAFTVEKKVGKWWSESSLKISIIKLIYIGIICAIFILAKYYIKIIKSKFELYFALEIILDFLESYCIFGPLPLFFQYMGFNEHYTTKSYEKINVNLREENEIQFFRATIFEDEKKGKKNDGYVVIDRNEKQNLIEDKENEEDINKIYKNENDNNIENINEEKDEKDNNEIYQPTSMIIKNLRRHEEEEGDFEFYIENENKDISNFGNSNDLKNEK